MAFPASGAAVTKKNLVISRYFAILSFEISDLMGIDGGVFSSAKAKTSRGRHSGPDPGKEIKLFIGL